MSIYHLNLNFETSSEGNSDYNLPEVWH